jgi:hypothetical protein
MAPPLQPEFFALVGINLFLAISLLTCLLDRHLPWQLPYVYQLAALAGFGQLLISKEFMPIFGEYMRFWYSFLYLIVALANIVAVNVYIGFVRKLLNYAKIFVFTITMPTIALVAFFLADYSQIAVHPLVIFPLVSSEATFIIIVALDTFVVGLGTYIFFKPKPVYLIAGAGTTISVASVYAFFKPSWGDATFVVSAIALAVACILVLGASIYILARIWIDTARHRKRRKEVK